MADPFVAEIRIFPFNFPPKGWAFCEGQLMPLSQNTALFSLLGTTYGGDGKSNFALPDLQGRMPMHHGQGPGLSLYDLGQTGGSDTVTLLESEIPTHTHTIQVSDNGSPAVSSPGPTAALGSAPNRAFVSAPVTGSVVMAPNQLLPAGGGQPHNNMPPYLTLQFCIALQGVFPPRG